MIIFFIIGFAGVALATAIICNLPQILCAIVILGIFIRVDHWLFPPPPPLTPEAIGLDKSTTTIALKNMTQAAFNSSVVTNLYVKPAETYHRAQYYNVYFKNKTTHTLSGELYVVCNATENVINVSTGDVYGSRHFPVELYNSDVTLLPSNDYQKFSFDVMSYIDLPSVLETQDTGVKRDVVLHDCRTFRFSYIADDYIGLINPSGSANNLNLTDYGDAHSDDLNYSLRYYGEENRQYYRDQFWND